MNNKKIGAAPQMYAGGDAKQAIEFAWPYILAFIIHEQHRSPSLSLSLLSPTPPTSSTSSLFKYQNHKNGSIIAHQVDLF